MAKRVSRSKVSPSDRPAIVEHVALRRERVPSFDQYPFNIPAIREMSTLPLHPAVTFLIGENGSGKSTLLEAMAAHMGFNAEGGSKNFNFGTRASHSALCDYLECARSSSHRSSDGFFLRAESYYNVATEIERLGISLRSYGGRSLHEQSHGESFLALMEHRFKFGGLYLLDEPEAALSPNRQLSVLTLMHDHAKMGSQFIIATHSPIILAYPHAAIYELSDGGIRPVKYEDTEQYRVMHMFMECRQQMLEELLGDEP